MKLPTLVMKTLIYYLGCATITSGLLAGCTPKKSATDTDRFPASFETFNPINDEWPSSMYISDTIGLEKQKHQVPENYANFYKNIDANLQTLSDTVTNHAFAEWLKSLIGIKKLLEVHQNDFSNQDRSVFSNYYLQFTSLTQYTEWKKYYPSYGFNVELVSPADLEGLPNPLKEIYSFGVIWLYGIPCSGYFYHPKNIIPATEEPYLKDYIEDYGDFPYEKCKVFFDDSGCYLMYDEEENVYCGGVECGKFYKSEAKLDEVITIIFTKLLKGDKNMDIESFAPAGK